MKVNFKVIISLLLLTPLLASADSWVPTNTHVTQIATAQLFVQGAVIFVLDKGTSDCPAGSYVYWYNSNVDQLKTWYASILAAHLAGTPVIVHFPTPGSCVTDNVDMGSY